MKKLFLSAVFFIIMYGCGGGSQTFLVEISTGTDDGHVSALTKFLPDTAYGMILNNFEDMGVGVATSGGGDTLTSRVLYRFNLSDWENSDVVLHVYCASIIGQPGSVEVLVLNDFGSIPNSSGTQPEDVSQWWFLVDSAEVAGEFTPVQGKWSNVSISSSLIPMITMRCALVTFIAAALYFSETSAIVRSFSGEIKPAGMSIVRAYVSPSLCSTALFSNRYAVSSPIGLITC